jgi:hypothetical protein
MAGDEGGDCCSGVAIPAAKGGLWVPDSMSAIPAPSFPALRPWPLFPLPNMVDANAEMKDIWGGQRVLLNN